MNLKQTLAKIEALSRYYLIDKPYIVGGIPRDYSLGREMKTDDIDLTTNTADIIRLGILTAEHFKKTFILFEDSHVTVHMDQFSLDFSSNFISEKVVDYLKSNNKNDPKFYEVYSRDFTINTLHQDLITKEIYDPTGQGLDDLKNSVIRTPVDPEITLNDDPRRIYRAINLAARYQFKIDDSLKEYVIQNPELIKSESIKDKFVSLKIGEALESNPQYTIELLKELNLLDTVPLSGKFKDYLIQNRLLLDYLNMKRRISKYAEFIAHDWQEYSEQGPQYQELAQWWQQNATALPGNLNTSYASWKDWYAQQKNQVWHGDRPPQEVLPLLKNLILQAQEYSGGFYQKQVDRENRKKKILNIIPSGSKAKTKDGVNIQSLTQPTKAFIEAVPGIARDLGVEEPVITSGYRPALDQARAMAKNWAKKGGTKYLIGLYQQDDIAMAIGQIFERLGVGEAGIGEAAALLTKNPISPHQRGDAVDLRNTQGIEQVLTEALRRGFNIKYLDEGDHHHVAVIA